MRLLLTGGRIIDPSQNLDEQKDILIEYGKITEIGRNIHKSRINSRKSTDEITVINVSGSVVAPGLIDMHTHLREPGFEYKETIRTGSEAAAAGGSLLLHVASHSGN